MSPALRVAGEASASDRNYTVFSALLPLGGSYLLFVTDQAEYDLGSVLASTPPGLAGTGAAVAPFSLIGLNEPAAARAIARVAATRLGRPVLVLCHLRERSRPELVTSVAMRAVTAVLDQAGHDIPLELRDPGTPR